MEKWYYRWYRHDDVPASYGKITEQLLFDTFPEALEHALNNADSLKLVPYDLKYEEYDITSCSGKYSKDFPEKYRIHKNEQGEDVLLVYEELGGDITPFLYILLSCLSDTGGEFENTESYIGFDLSDWMSTGHHLWRGYDFHQITLSEDFLKRELAKLTGVKEMRRH